jgi:DNA-binding MarR family transcriptional regulator
MKDLTPRQKEIYDQIKNLKEKYPQLNPTAAQLARLFNMSRQGMNEQLISMEIKGYIKRVRGVEITR